MTGDSSNMIKLGLSLWASGYIIAPNSLELIELLAGARRPCGVNSCNGH